MASYDPNQTPLISETVLKRRRTLDELAYRRSSKFYISISLLLLLLLLLLFYILYYINKTNDYY